MLTKTVYTETMSTYTNTELVAMLKKRIEASSNKAVAEELGIYPSAVSPMASGKKPITLRVARWLLETNHVTIERLFRSL
jgi:predicted transcriptional regulator